MYGGVTEVGDVEVTLDDCWSIDLSKRDQWRRVLQGVMHTLVWRGEDADATTEVGVNETSVFVNICVNCLADICFEFSSDKFWPDYLFTYVHSCA